MAQQIIGTVEIPDELAKELRDIKDNLKAVIKAEGQKVNGYAQDAGESGDIIRIVRGI